MVLRGCIRGRRVVSVHTAKLQVEVMAGKNANGMKIRIGRPQSVCDHTGGMQVLEDRGGDSSRVVPGFDVPAARSIRELLQGSSSSRWAEAIEVNRVDVGLDVYKRQLRWTRKTIFM